ncbi:MAG: porin [Rhodobacteraceae bacterium]|nr:porin [Paracoccaceae bacterium]
MKKILIASTALTMLAGAASADVTVAGKGYFGLQYYSKPAAGMKKTVLYSRLQFEIKGSKTTDSGLTFHGKVRIRSQQDMSHAGATPINAGQVGVTAGPLDVTVGNVSDAIDALTLYWNSELGICGCGGETLNYIARGNGFNGYSSQGGGNNGVLATYTVGTLVVRASYQSHNNLSATKGEAALSVAYKAGPLSFELGYVDNKRSASIAQLGYQGYTGVVEYALGNSNIGLAYGSSKDTDGATGVKDKSVNTVTLYGNTKFGATTVQAFVSNTSVPAPGGVVTANFRKVTYGLGGAYDLGSGAAMVGSVRTTNTKGGTYADLGVTFSF